MLQICKNFFFFLNDIVVNSDIVIGTDCLLLSKMNDFRFQGEKILFLYHRYPMKVFFHPVNLLDGLFSVLDVVS